MLHRDISPGNIIIKWKPGSEVDQPSDSGCLIDLDHAKKGKSVQDQVQRRHDDRSIDNVHASIRLIADVEVEREVARLSLEYSHRYSMGPAKKVASSYAIDVVAHALEFCDVTKDQLMTTQHLRWKQVRRTSLPHSSSHFTNQVQTSYDFGFHPSECQKGSRTVRLVSLLTLPLQLLTRIQGTPPYASGEVLSGRRYFCDRSRYFHDAVHDLESFFWVLVQICITRQGPGGARRDELQETNKYKKEHGKLARVVLCFFDSDTTTMVANKQEIFYRTEDLDEHVLDHFHDYFQPFRKTVKEWYHLLILAHQYHAFEYHDIHDMVLDILNRALGSLPHENIGQMGRKVLDERKANIEFLCDNPFGKVQRPPPEHTSSLGRKAGTAVAHYSPPSSPRLAPLSKKIKLLEPRIDSQC